MFNTSIHYSQLAMTFEVYFNSLKPSDAYMSL